MKLQVFLVTSAVLALGLSALAFGDELPVPGSCSQSSLGAKLCDCSLQSSADPSSIIQGTVPCDSLLCFDMKTAANDPGCVERHATCELQNAYYAGGVCREAVVYDQETVPTAQAACSRVLSCLNDVSCIGFYCMGTTIRSGWTLQSVIDSPRPQN